LGLRGEPLRGGDTAEHKKKKKTKKGERTKTKKPKTATHKRGKRAKGHSKQVRQEKEVKSSP